MINRVKIFSNTKAVVEKSVNDFLESKYGEINIVDINVACADAGEYTTIVVMIIYEEV